MMDRRRTWAAVGAVSAWLILIGVVAGLAHDRDDDDEGQTFTFALWGDMPYTDAEIPKVPALIADINAAHVAFSVFDGDIKSGSSQCTDEVYATAIQRFDTFRSPMVYVPGDNEWTDCHRKNNGSFNALERLAFLRQTMFADESSFGQRTMRLAHQGPLGGVYAENTRWTHGDVVFVGLNIPGSNNNKVDLGANGDCTGTPPPASACLSSKSARNCDDCKADNVEYAARDAANIQWLHSSFALAKSRHLRGLMVIIQADMSFDVPETETFNERTQVPGFEGYNNTLAALVSEAQAFDGQVVLVHGDTHFFKLDKPLVDDLSRPFQDPSPAPPHLIANFSRLETFGSPNVHWVKVTVDPRSRSLFRFEPMIVPGN